MRFKVPVTVLTTSVERFNDKEGKEVAYGLYIAQGDDAQFPLLRGTCSEELANTLTDYKGVACKLIYELRTDEKFKPVIKLVGVE